MFTSTKHQPIIINMKDLLADNKSTELNKFSAMISPPNKNSDKNVDKNSDKNHIVNIDISPAKRQSLKK